MQNLPPQIIKTPEAKIEQVSQSLKAFNLATEIATSLVPKIPNNEESGESNQLAQNRIRFSGIAYLAGSNKNNINHLNNGIVYCDDSASFSNNCSDNTTENPYFIDNNGRRNDMKGYAAVYTKGNRLGGSIMWNNYNGKATQVHILADLSNTEGKLLITMSLEDFARNFGFNPINRINIRNVTNIKDISSYKLREVMENIRESFVNRSEIKTLDQYVAMTIAEKNISTEIPKPAYFDFGSISSNVPN